MKNVQLINKKRKIIEKFKDFNIVDYFNKVFHMYSGESQMVELQFYRSLINVVIDCFGKKVLFVFEWMLLLVILF